MTEGKSAHPTPVRSSVAEYLTFVASTGASNAGLEVRYEDENIWLTQKMMATLYDVDLPAISEQISRIYADGELTEKATVRKYRTVQTEGERQITRNQDHYNLHMIIAVGFRLNTQRAVRFRKWLGQTLKDHGIQGWTMDVERLKNGHLFTDKYFERQLQLIDEIRLSERKFYQKITDLYASAFDYDKEAATTRHFFRTVSEKLRFAVNRHPTAEPFVERDCAGYKHRGLSTWENAPDGKILKSDVTVAKNYLTQEEMRYLERIVSMYLDYAELQAERRIPMSMEDWAKRLDGFLEFNGNELLTGPGKISAEEAKLHAETEYENYRIVQDRLYRSDFDRFMLEAQSCHPDKS